MDPYFAICFLSVTCFVLILILIDRTIRINKALKLLGEAEENATAIEASFAEIREEILRVATHEMDDLPDGVYHLLQGGSNEIIDIYITEVKNQETGEEFVIRSKKPITESSFTILHKS